MLYRLLYYLAYALAFGYIINNRKKSENIAKNSDFEKYEHINSSQNKDEGKTNVDIKAKEAEKILPNSRIGIDILKNFQITNVYSAKFYKLLDSEGLSDKVKRSWSFINIIQGNDYLYMLNYSEDSSYTYISESDLITVSSSIFYNGKSILSGDIIYDFKFNEKDKRYEIPSIGISGGNDVITVEVPYEILEYENGKYEVYMYRIYLKQTMSDLKTETQEQFANIITSVYYDENLSNKACQIEDDGILSNLEGQRDILRSYIQSKKIDSNLLQKTKYTLLKEGTSYKISEYEKL